jgi:hypothetical protein
MLNNNLFWYYFRVHVKTLEDLNQAYTMSQQDKNAKIQECGEKVTRL